MLSRQGETVKLKLDIDETHADQNEETAYAFSWRPTTGNLMYMMPAEGSQVSLYFPTAREEGAMTVNCIRQEGEAGGRDYRERGLSTEGKELKLYPQVMGLEGEEAKLLLEDTGGINISGKKNLQIFAGGGIRLVGRTITLSGGEEGVHLYRGRIEEKGKNREFIPTAQLHLYTCQGKERLVCLAGDTYLLGYRQEDYSGDSCRFKDDPLEEQYDWGTLNARVVGGLVIVGTVVIAVGSGAAMAGVGLKVTLCIMGATAACGSVAVGALGIQDALTGRISSMTDYVKTALNGSIIGAMTGATAFLPTQGLGLLGRGLVEFGIGAIESAVEQQIWEEDIDPREMIRYGILEVALSEALEAILDQGKMVGRSVSYADMMSPEDAKRYLDFLENGSRAGLTSQEIAALEKVDELLALNKINYQDILDLRNTGRSAGSGSSSTITDSVDIRLNSLVNEIRTDIGKEYPVGNVGAAITDIEGVTPEIKAYSKINNSISSQNINHEYSYNLGSNNRIFDTVDVNSQNIVNGPKAFNRCIDTESKILEDIAHQLGYNTFAVDESIVGNVYLITERAPCPSCEGVIAQFKEMFPNVNVEVKYIY